MFGGNGAWWIIILFLFAFVGWGGNGWGRNGNSGAADNYVLASDFATVQRMISDATNSLERRLDNTQSGLCDLGYTQAQLINGVQVGQMQQGYETRIAVNGVGQKLSDCCCDIKQEIAGVNNGLGRAIERGFCDTNYNLQAQHNATMIAIDKVGDRVIDYLNSTECRIPRRRTRLCGWRLPSRHRTIIWLARCVPRLCLPIRCRTRTAATMAAAAAASEGVAYGG